MRGQRGFSLAELLAGLAVLGLILAGVFTLQRQGQFAYLMGAARVEAQQNARLALELMVRELRSAQSVTAAPSCNTGGTDLTFADQDGVTVRYRLEGATLQRTAAGVTTGLIAGVEALSFRCFQADGVTATATAGSVRSVLISIRTRPEDVSTSSTYSPSFQRKVAESRVRLRNVL
jgi:prepilin-type N-terminal cleavage/methylation domain-containing protein